VVGCWGGLYSDQLHNMYILPYMRVMKSRMMRLSCSIMGKMRNVDKILIIKVKGLRQLRRHKHRWENGIRMGLREMVGSCGLDSSGWE